MTLIIDLYLEVLPGKSFEKLLKVAIALSVGELIYGFIFKKVPTCAYKKQA